MALRSIPTRYKGITFRSRLEARWAVFMDLLELPWGYEVQGFDLGDVGWYLPDFEVSGAGIGGFFAEVKPWGGLTPQAVSKIEAVAYQGRAIAVVMEGRPSPDVKLWDGELGIDAEAARFMNCRRCDGIWLECHSASFSVRCTCGDKFGEPLLGEEHFDRPFMAAKEANAYDFLSAEHG